jgi:tetratricopeptide (TPR) repeat protein
VKLTVNPTLRFGSFLLFAAVLCLLLVFCCPQPASAKDSWVSVRSKNFLLIGNANEKEIRKVAVRLEQFREVFSRLFVRANFKSSVPTTVIVFNSDSYYRPFKPMPNVAGYFQSGPDVNYITLTTESRSTEQNPFSVIFHEYTHLLINATSGNVPTWFNEGLAEYYSTFSIEGDRRVVLGSPIANHVYLLRERRMLPLRALFKVDHDSPEYNERDKRSIFYAESWVLMHYLLRGKDGKRVPQMVQFLDLLNANVPMEQAFQKAFSMSFEDMESELLTYIQRDRYPVFSGQFESKVQFNSEMQSAPITEAEAQAYLGDLLLHSNRFEAEAYLKKALELDPNLAMAHASLGMLRVREGKPLEARKNLERAVAANSKNYLIHYYYAYALSREGMDEREIVTEYLPETADKMRAEIKKAIELRPDFPETYGLLAFVNLVTNSQLDESVVLLKHALVISPGRSDLVLTLAQIYMRKQEYQTARELLKRLSENTADAVGRRRAEALLGRIVFIEEQIARLRAEGNPGLTESGGKYSLQDTEVVENPDPSAMLRDALRKPLADEMQLQGTLTRIDCEAKGIVFTIKVGDRQLKMKTESFAKMNFVSFTETARGEITCGLRRPESAVVINYLPATDTRAKIDGVMKSMQFVPSDFKLKAEK